MPYVYESVDFYFYSVQLFLLCWNGTIFRISDHHYLFIYPTALRFSPIDRKKVNLRESEVLEKNQRGKSYFETKTDTRKA